jgi:hypothetical protein
MGRAPRHLAPARTSSRLHHRTCRAAAGGSPACRARAANRAPARPPAAPPEPLAPTSHAHRPALDVVHVRSLWWRTPGRQARSRQRFAGARERPAGPRAESRASRHGGGPGASSWVQLPRPSRLEPPRPTPLPGVRRTEMRSGPRGRLAAHHPALGRLDAVVSTASPGSCSCGSAIARARGFAPQRESISISAPVSVTSTSLPRFRASRGRRGGSWIGHHRPPASSRAPIQPSRGGPFTQRVEPVHALLQDRGRPCSGKIAGR